jgi:hypothetical protein
MFKTREKRYDNCFRSGLWDKRRKRGEQPWNWRAPLRSVNVGDAIFATEVEWDKFYRMRSLKDKLRVLGR